MLITSSPNAAMMSRVNTQPAIAPKEESIATLPSESFTFSASDAGKSHYSGGSIAGRVISGAVTGLLAEYVTGGDTWATAKLGAAVSGGVGAVVGGLGGAVVGAAAGNPGAGALIGAGVGGGVGVVSGGVKGALVAVVGNAFGGGALAFAASGAVLGAIGL